MRKRDVDFVISVLKEEKIEYDPDWYSVLGFLFCHRITALFYNRAKKCGVKIPEKIEGILSDTYKKQKRKVVFMRNELARITKKLADEKVRYALLKGSVVSNLSESDVVLYTDGERVSNDVDILVNQDEISSVSKALYELGFVQGVYDKDKNEITEFSRTEIVKRRINRGEVAPFVKKSEDAEFPYVEADINFSLGNTPTEGAELLRGMIDSARDYSGKILMRIPDGEMFFLHLIMHQYKESRLMFTVERNKDTDLYKLADIYYMLKADIPDLERMEFLIKKYGIEREAGYVLRQTGEIFSDWRILSFAEKFKGAVPEVIDYENGKTYERTGNERRRLCSFDKKKFLREVNHD